MDQRKYLRSTIGLIGGASAAAIGSYRKTPAQGEPAKNEPPMIACPDPNTKTPTFKLPPP
jgi:hypothetical protein